jgi:PTH1 family peptidyl-tRNA hydrolase
MKLIIGLGNPESRYDGTRHNTGFFVLDELAKEHGVTWQLKEKFKAHLAELPGKTALLVKPTTYYNLVGESVRALADFYKIPPEDILIIHDELALPFGTLRTREKGSDAGNNGIKSLNSHLGHTTKRLRIGIQNELTAHMDAADFVLAKYTPSEKRELAGVILPHVKTHVQKFLNNNFELTKITAK